MTVLQEFNDWMCKQAPPGPPPRPGLEWNPQSHRWVRSVAEEDDEDKEDYEDEEDEKPVKEIGPPLARIRRSISIEQLIREQKRVRETEGKDLGLREIRERLEEA